MDPIAVKFQHSQEVCWICERPDRDLFDLTAEQSEKLMQLSQLQVRAPAAFFRDCDSISR